MEYQKLLTEEEISKIYVAEGDIVSFYNTEGKLCTKKSNGEVSSLEERVEQLESQIIQSSPLVDDISDLIG